MERRGHMLQCFEVLIPPTDKHPTSSPSSIGASSTNWLNWSSYELGLFLKGLRQYIDSFYEGHQIAITGRQGVPFGERLPRVTDEAAGGKQLIGGGIWAKDR